MWTPAHALFFSPLRQRSITDGQRQGSLFAHKRATSDPAIQVACHGESYAVKKCQKAKQDSDFFHLSRNLLTSHPSREIVLGDLQRISSFHTRKQIERTRYGSRPPGLVAGSETRAIVSVEMLVEQNVISPVRIVLKLLCSAVDGRFPFASRRKMLDSLRAISFATSNKVMWFPEPVGHSTLKSLP
jgi:hypothetical protein